MSNHRPYIRWIACLCGLLFIAGMGRLFWLRFEVGDLYPAYSSLRCDPLGAEALYESLGEVDPGGVHRNFTPLDHVSLDPAATFLVCGLTVSPGALAVPRWKPLLDAVAAGGGRLVVTFSAAAMDRKAETDGGQPTPPGHQESDHVTGSKDPGGTDDGGVACGLWGLGLILLQGGKDGGNAHRCPGEPDWLPGTLIRRSPLYFELMDSSWRAVYTAGDRVVVAQRPWGRGEVVMVADSYLFSNEALRYSRSPGFLAWALPPRAPIVFDEIHNGLSRQPGLAGLMRKYRLHGVVLTLALLVLLTIWRQGTVFVPRVGDPVSGESEIALGRDATAGWISLLHRHIPPRDLLFVCHEAWRSSAAADRIPGERAEHVAQLIVAYRADPRHQQPAAVYRSICKTLKQETSS